MENNIEDYPVVVNENGDLNFFESKALAELALEPVDVKNNEYVVYDFLGRVCKANVSTGKRSGFARWGENVETTKITIDEKKKPNPHKLRVEILTFFKKSGFFREELSQKNLSDLIAEAIEQFGHS